MKVGMLDMLVLLFLTLKLTGVISWSWWWVFSPWLIPVAIMAFFWLIGLFMFAAAKAGRKGGL